MSDDDVTLTTYHVDMSSFMDAICHDMMGISFDELISREQVRRDAMTPDARDLEDRICEYVDRKMLVGDGVE